MRTRVLGAVVAVWSAAFAVVHVAWACGWRAGVPDDVAPISHRPVFLTYDLLAAAALAAAAVIGALWARGGHPRATRRLLGRLTILGSMLALLRGAPAVVIDLVTGGNPGVGPLADAWFTVAGLLGLALAFSARHDDGGSLAESRDRSRPDLNRPRA